MSFTYNPLLLLDGLLSSALATLFLNCSLLLLYFQIPLTLFFPLCCTYHLLTYSIIDIFMTRITYSLSHFTRISTPWRQGILSDYFLDVTQVLEHVVALGGCSKTFVEWINDLYSWEACSPFGKINYMLKKRMSARIRQNVPSNKWVRPKVLRHCLF